MNRNIIALAVTATLAGNPVHASPEADSDPAETGNQPVAIGIGAVSGAILAGPLGMVAGGILGNYLGRPDTADDTLPLASTDLDVEQEPSVPVDADIAVEPGASLLAAAGPVPQVSPTPPAAGNRIREIVIDNLRMPVHFRSGSTDVESFYSRQLDSIARLLHEFPDVVLQLEAYSDRQGDAAENLDLSQQRLDEVRARFIDAGIGEDRITAIAHGEKQFLSAPGDLDAYVFDRRVVISLQRPQPETGSSFAAIAAD